MTGEHHADRRSFLRTGAIAGTALVAGATAMAEQVARAEDSDARITKGDIAILRFLAAADKSRAISGNNTTNSEESKIAKFQAVRGTDFLRTS